MIFMNEQRDKAQPYYTGKPPGAESFKQFLRNYAGMAELLFDSFPANKISLEISDGNWACREDEMLSFLDVNRIPSPNAFPQNGIYTNEKLGFVIRVDGLSIIQCDTRSHNQLSGIDYVTSPLFR